MLGQPLTPALALLVAPVPLRGLILMLLLQVPARAGGTACGGACALESRGAWRVEKDRDVRFAHERTRIFSSSRSAPILSSRTPIRDPLLRAKPDSESSSE